MSETAAAEAFRSVRRHLAARVLIALSGTLLGASAVLMAVLSVIAGDDRALWWMLAAIIGPTWSCSIAWSRLMSAWSSSTDKVRYFELRPSRPFKLVGRLSAHWLLLSQLIALGALVWLVMRLVDGASGWLGVAIPVVIVAGLTAMGSAFTVAYDSSDLGRSIFTFAMAKNLTDGHIQKELENNPYLGGLPDWNSFWLHRIAYFTDAPPVDRPAQDCVDYIITARAAAGLPPLAGVETAVVPADAAKPKAIVSGVLRVNGHDLGLAADSAVTVRDGVLDADLTAAAVPARAETWALAPPRLYFHGLDVSDRAANGRIDIDEASLDDYDIGCYLDAHFDVFSTLTVEASRLHFSGKIAIAVDDRWPVEIEVAVDGWFRLA